MKKYMLYIRMEKDNKKYWYLHGEYVDKAFVLNVQKCLAEVGYKTDLREATHAN